jgi:putative tricarboxylic transport membrane protein
LWIAAVGSFIAGTFGSVMISVIGPGIAKYALKFGPPEYFGLIFFSMTAIISLSGSSIAKGLGIGMVGMLLACVGVDPLTGLTRFSWHSIGMMRGLDIVPLTVGLFGIAEVFINAELGLRAIYEGKIGKMMPRGKELAMGLKASVRGTLLGFPLGLLPGVIPGIIGFLAYDLEKKFSKHPEKFGTGVIEGVASVEAANNATAQAGFLPLMSFGIPTGPSTAIILAALIMYGLQPGPVLFTTKKLFVWTVIASMYIGNVVLLILNLPLVKLWARISTIPYKYLGPVIFTVCVVGAYSPRSTMFDVWVALGAGIVGFLMRKNNWPVAPLILGFILGPMFEQSLRQSISMGGPLIFFQRPLTMILILLAIFVLILSIKVLKRVPKALLEEDAD